MEQRLATLLPQLDVGVFRCSVQGELLEANEAFLKLIKQPSLEAARALASSQSLLQQQPCEQVIAHLLKTGQRQERDVELADADGKLFWIRLCATLSATPDGATVIDGLIEDITQRKRDEEKSQARAAAAARFELLSPREREVLQLVVAGKANKVIARQLGISEKTIEKHRASLMKKLHVHSVAEVVRLAVIAEPTR